MNRKLQYAIVGGDLLWIGGAFVFTNLLSNGQNIGRARLAALSVHIPAVLAALLVRIVLYVSKKLEGFRKGWHLPSVFAGLIVGVCYLIGALVVLALCANYEYSREELLYISGLLPLGFIGIRCSAWRFITLRARRRSRVVILGAGRPARELAHKITLHPEMSMEVAGVLFPSDADPARQLANMPPRSISLRSLNILNLLQKNNVQELIIVEPAPPGPETKKLISGCRTAGIRIHLVPQRYELYLSKAELNEIDDVPLLSLEERKLPPMGVRVKRCIDIVGALLLLALSAPLLALSSAALYGPKRMAFPTDPRCGRNGVPCWMYRLEI